MKEYLAHSARDGYPSQSYKEHVENVRNSAVINAMAAACYAELDGDMLIHTVDMAACVHDLGKLIDENQKALAETNNREKLPVNHVDAGVASLKQCSINSSYAQVAVYSHHRGLPDFPEEENREEEYFRDKDAKTRKLVDEQLNYLNCIHEKVVPDAVAVPQERDLQGNNGMFIRIMLSCLTDADHSDTAHHYGRYTTEESEPALRAEERLQKLDAYVSRFSGENERNRLRSEMYQSCRASDVAENIVACDSPVGSGKTTAVMAHLLSQAIRRKARRIFVVLPFTNIIRQSVNIYRKALVLPGEDEEKVIAELHYRADFENADARILTAQWRAPIIVTTAVAFFETLASNKPSGLRRLHELPGSLIFVDEAHAALPVKLLPLAWQWMQVLADEWKCYWVLTSGSLVKFWELKAEDWKRKERNVPQILSTGLREKLMGFEKARIEFSYVPQPLSREDLVKRVISAPGPRLLIMNTVQSAAVMAKDLQAHYGQCESNKVLHLSTSLNADDRARIVANVSDRLYDDKDTDWTLVATSCVEAGVDFSFKTGFREMASLLSLLQAAGRVNRNGSDNEAVIWSFVMQDDPMIKSNLGVKVAAQILKRFFDTGVEIQPDLSTKSMQRELNLSVDDLKQLMTAENNLRFPVVQENFRVIGDDTVLAIADDSLIEQVRHGKSDWREIQKKSVSIRRYYVSQYDLQPLSEGLYVWHLGYDDFLGIMKGVLGIQRLKSETLIV